MLNRCHKQKGQSLIFGYDEDWGGPDGGFHRIWLAFLNDENIRSDLS